MRKRVHTIRTIPILRRGTVKLTGEENCVVLRELVGEHMNKLAALLQLGFLIVEQRGPNYKLRHTAKGSTVILEAMMDDLPKSSRQAIERMFRRRS